MGVFLITLAILTLAVFIFKQVWKMALKFFYYFILALVDIVKKIIVATKRLAKIVFILYYRHKNGRYFKKEIPETQGIEVDERDIPEGLRKELGVHNEVVVKNDEIDPSEF